ncbi:MAG TPA: diguanylate cyclase [Alphaproteobacteria bacterium]|nr:diguanylate cyclase [Alphaproteobacteria bacterium]
MIIKKELFNFRKYFDLFNSGSPLAFDENRFLAWMVLFAGLICIMLGAISLIGWYTNTPILFQMLPGLTPMYYNTALCLIVIGTALIILISGHKKIAALLGIFVTILAVLTMLEYSFGINLGIDELFFKTELSLHTAAPGRMSPNSALSFFLCGISLVILSVNNISRLFYFIVLLLGMIVLALGSISLLGYAAQLPSTYQWAKLTPMALHTAIGVIIASGGMIIYVYGKHVSDIIDLSAILPYFASIFVLCVASFLWSASLQQEKENIQELTSFARDELLLKIQNKLEGSVSNLKEFGSQVQLAPNLPDNIWRTYQEFYKQKMPWLKPIEWVDSTGHNRGGSSVSLSHNSFFQETLKMAKKEQDVAISKIINLTPNEPAILIYVPLFDKSQPNGFIISSIGINDMLKNIAQGTQSSKFEFALFEGIKQKQSFFRTSNTTDPDIYAQKEIKLYNLHWVIKTWPSPHFLRSHTQILSKLIFLVGILIAFLLFVIIRSRQTATAQALVLNHTKKNLELKLVESNLHMRELQLLNDFTQSMQACSSLKMATRPIAKYCQLLFPTTSGAVYLADYVTGKLHPFAKWGLSGSKLSSFSVSKCMAFLKRNPCYGSGNGYGDPCEHQKRFASNKALTVNLCLPLKDKDSTLGLLHIREYPSTNLDENPFLLPQTIAIQLSISISNIRKGDILKDQSIRDPLTNLFNRRYLSESLPQELHYAQRQTQPLSILMIDIDYFKKVNDKYGHEAGDVVIKHIALLLEEHFRKSDVPCRYGGEEFLLVLPGTSLVSAMHKSEKLRQAVIDFPFSFHGKNIQGLTVSIGVASFPQHGISSTTLIAASDRALYKAKELGRNRVEVAKNEPLNTKAT